jgi:butyrate kinase
MEDGDEKADLVFRTMAYQVAKEIGSRAASLEGEVDAILLTGGLAYSDVFVDEIRRRVAFIAPVKVYPGEDELKALADGAYRVMSGKESPRVYER